MRVVALAFLDFEPCQAVCQKYIRRYKMNKRKTLLMVVLALLTLTLGGCFWGPGFRDHGGYHGGGEHYDHRY